MKVLYFHQHFSTPNGSVGTRSYEFAKRLVARGHHVTMVCGSYSMAVTGLTGEPSNGVRRGCVDGIDVVEIALEYSNYDSLPKRSWTAIRFAWKSIRIALAEHYDVLFATSTPLTASLPGIVMRICKPCKKFVFEVRDLWPELPKSMGVIRNPLVLLGLSILEKTSYLAMHAGVALSPGIQDGMRRRTPEGKGIDLIPNGCDLDAFQPRHVSNTPTVPDGYPLEGLRCVFSGAHGVANGLDAVLDAAQVLQDWNRTDICMVFVGDGRLKPSLIERCQRDRLTNCHFLGPLPKHQLARVFQNAELGLMILSNVPAFYYGTSPNKFFDYAAAGLPILNNYPGWLAEMITEHKCGFAVAPGDAVAFAECVARLADEPQLVRRMGDRARLLAETEFDRLSLADRFVDLLENISGTRSLALLTVADQKAVIADETELDDLTHQAGEAIERSSK